LCPAPIEVLAGNPVGGRRAQPTRLVAGLVATAVARKTRNLL